MPSTSEEGGGASGTQPSLITVPVNIPLPGRMDLSGGNLPVKWQRFCRAWSKYEIAAQLKDPENPGRNKERRAATLLTCIGSDALDVINAMESENEDQRKDPEVILEKMKQYCPRPMKGVCSTVGTKSQMNQLMLMSPHYDISDDMQLRVINRLTYS